MFLTLIICTYQRPLDLLRLLHSVKEQFVLPNQILIVDGSLDNHTFEAIQNIHLNNLQYHRVGNEQRGLTRQRNYGISMLDPDSEITCFLDDDVVLEKSFFQEILKVFKKFPDAMGVGGYSMNEVDWKKAGEKRSSKFFHYEDMYRTEPLRFRIRKYFGLNPKTSPGLMPSFGHMRAISYLPPTGKNYKVECLMGCAMTFRNKVFESLSFSKYFEGYGLYEDADFCLRVAKLGDIYVATSARLDHLHAPGGRPNWFKYGQMVITNGWYVWRVRFPHPTFKASIKWRLCSLLLIGLTFSSPSKKAFAEGMGRLLAWIKLFFSKPKIQS